MNQTQVNAIRHMMANGDLQHFLGLIEEIKQEALESLVHLPPDEALCRRQGEVVALTRILGLPDAAEEAYHKRNED